jgi:hypothetical protein
MHKGTSKSMFLLKLGRLLPFSQFSHGAVVETIFRYAKINLDNGLRMLYTCGRLDRQYRRLPKRESYIMAQPEEKVVLHETANCRIIEHNLEDQKTKELVCVVPKIVLKPEAKPEDVDWSEAVSLAQWLDSNVQFDERVKRGLGAFHVVQEGTFRLAGLGLDPRRTPSAFDVKSFRADMAKARADGSLDAFLSENVDDYVNFALNEITRKAKGAIDLGMTTAEKVEQIKIDKEAEIRGTYGEGEASE